MFKFLSHNDCTFRLLSIVHFAHLHAKLNHWQDVQWILALPCNFRVEECDMFTILKFHIQRAKWLGKTLSCRSPAGLARRSVGALQMRQGYEMRPTCFTRGSLLSDLHLLSTLLAHQMSVQSGTNVAATIWALDQIEAGMDYFCCCGTVGSDFFGWQKLLLIQSRSALLLFLSKADMPQEMFLAMSALGPKHITSDRTLLCLVYITDDSVVGCYNACLSFQPPHTRYVWFVRG